MVRDCALYQNTKPVGDLQFVEYLPCFRLHENQLEINNRMRSVIRALVLFRLHDVVEAVPMGTVPDKLSDIRFSLARLPISFGVAFSEICLCPSRRELITMLFSSFQVCWKLSWRFSLGVASGIAALLPSVSLIEH